MEILTPTGYRNIEDLTIGDAVIGKDGAPNTLLGKRTFDAGWFFEQELPGDWKWYLINGVYHFFGNQNIIVAEGDYTVCHVKELETGWKIYDDNGSILLIGSIEEAEPNDVWYKLDISGDHSFIADGVLVHNASRFWVGGGSATTWIATSNTNWAATSGGSNNASVPGSSDDVTFDGAGASGNTASTVSQNITVLSLTFSSGYTNTVTVGSGAVVLTIAGNFTDNSAHVWTVTSSALRPMTISASSTITSGGKTWPSGVTFSNTNTKTLSGDWTISGDLQTTGSTTFNKTTSEVMNCNGLAGTNTCSGTITIVLKGGTWSNSSPISVSELKLDGNITISSSPFFQTGTLTYVSGTITTSGSTLSINASTTLNTNGITWNNITIATTSTITINSLLSASGTLAISTGVVVTFAGTAGFTVGTLTISNTSSTSHSFKNGITYTITTALNAFTSRTGSILTLSSDHATNTAAITLQQGATCNCLASFTRIDASGGRQINTFNGTLTSCVNIHVFTDVEGIFQSNSRIIGAASTY